MLLGIDEVGRGSWAGPLVVGAVVLGSAKIDGLMDSKVLTKKRREELDVIIRQYAQSYGLGWVSAIEIDEIGLSQALKLATIRAVEQIKAPYHEIVIDGTVNFLKETSKGGFVTTLKKADSLVPCVSAASIIAKVARDRYMADQAHVNPKYGFERHVGYGTERHSQAIDELGICNLHRTSFKPIAKIMSSKTSKQIGDSAENVASGYLESLGHAIVERNWKTKFCEIDIVSTIGKALVFTEVKYRKDDKAGGGVQAVDVRKLKRMRRAAEAYAVYTKITFDRLALNVISMTGEPPVVVSLIEVS
jgi:ribonuclease HII